MESGPRRQTLALAIVLTAIIALLVGAAGAWLARSIEVDDLEARLETAERRLAEIAEADDASNGDTPDVAPDDTGTEEPATPTPPGATERVPAIVVGVRTAGGTHHVTLDYIQFLTGDAAAAAATAAGEESPPPNDYFIVNENPRLREFAIDAAASVTVVVNPDGTSVPEGQDMPLDEWVAAVSGPDADYYTMNFYWVTITDDIVTAIEQQYLP
ncbi:MAG: hypothetical protein U1E08_00465 [Coriobacteriia bacterium]|nr:hypothetical protein [Actinomycetota bacterium]MDZ4166160.1 hypothetical protein [Coriobacteriia bacterium]